MSATNASTSETNAQSSANASSKSAQASATSEANAKQYATNAKTSETSASKYASDASISASTASKKADIATTKATESVNSASDSLTYSNQSKNYRDQCKSIAQGLEGALFPKGTITFSNLPTSNISTGAMYNISDDFTSDNRFKDGAGKTYTSGTNIYYTSDGLWDVLIGDLEKYAFKTDLEDHIRNKENPHGVTKSQVGLGNVDNTSDTNKPVSTAQQTAIDDAYANANKYTDKKVADLIGSAPETMDTLEEVAAAIQENKDVETALNAAIGTKANQSELDTHTGNSTIHITASERTKWNAAKTHADSTHARTDATKVEKSTTNGNIKIDGTETTVYIHPSGTNPHGTTKGDVGLGNVGNFKAVSTVANQGLNDTEKLNARANIGAGTSSFSGSYNDLTNKPTIPSVGNGTVTIKQAGTSKGTFTMNQTGNTTIELTDTDTTYTDSSGNTYLPGNLTINNGSSDMVEITKNSSTFNTPLSAESISCRGNLTVGGSISGSLSGNASTATKLSTARTISLTGSVTGSGSFDGSGNLSITTTTNHTHSYLSLSGGTLTGAVTMNAALTFGKNDSYGIFPATTNYGSIGSSSKYFYQSFITNMSVEELKRKSATSSIGGNTEPFNKIYVKNIIVPDKFYLRPASTTSSDVEYTDVDRSVWLHGFDGSSVNGKQAPGLLLRQGSSFYQIFPSDGLSGSSVTDIGHTQYKFRNIVGKNLFSDSGTVSTSSTDDCFDCNL